MTDRITREHRSWNMSRIRDRDTIPERTVRSLLHRLGLRFRLHRRDLPGKPDIILPKYNTAMFIHGCFWHRHDRCSFAYTPKTRTEFWETKFEMNVKRDLEVSTILQKLGWRTVIVWECEIRNIDLLEERLRKEFGLIPTKY